MLGVLEILVISFVLGLPSFLIIRKLVLMQRNKAEALQAISLALRVNSRLELENVLFLHGKYLDKTLKKDVKGRIAELSIQEDELKELQDNDFQLQNKGQYK
jgi:hypothetical protein